MYFIFIILFIFELHCYALHLSPINHKILNKLIRSGEISPSTRKILNKMLFLGYEKWAEKQAYEFKKKNYYKCTRVPMDELVNYAKCGLHKCTLNYNGYSNFTNYASIYVNFELKQALTDSYSLSILPKKMRVSSKANMTEIEKEDYKKMLHIETRSNPSFLYDNKQQTPIDVYNKYESNYELWVKLNELDPFIKRCLHLKYSYDFKQIRTNKQVAEMMCCSSETIRKTYNNSNIFSLISL